MWIQTISGKQFNFSNIEPEAICLEDIAHSLSNICRFNGHTKSFYSVAEHCVVMSYLVPAEAQAGALMHDAGEAYIGDISTPLKNLAPALCDIENRILVTVLQKYSIDYAAHRGLLKEADLRMLETERLQLMANYLIENWECTRGVEAFDVGLPCWSQSEAKAQFLQRAELLNIID